MTPPPLNWPGCWSRLFLRRVTGVQLKDESDNPALHGKIKPLTPLK